MGKEFQRWGAGRRWGAGLVCLLLSIHPACAQPAPVISAPVISAPVTSAPVTIAAFGDSITAGYGLPQEQSYPSVMERMLRAEGIEAHVINDGVSGETSANGLARVDAVIQQKPAIAIVAFGGNDLLRALPLPVTQTSLEGIARRLHDAGIKLLITGPAAPPTMGMSYANAYNALFCGLAKEYDGLCDANFLAGIYGDGAFMQPDGIHPNAAGAQRIAQALAPLVEELAER